MPIFEYRCKKCGETFEKIVFGSDTRIECPKCRSQETEKLLSTFATGKSGKTASASPSSCGPGGFS